MDYLVQEDKLNADVLDCIRHFYQLNTQNADVSQNIRNDLNNNYTSVDGTPSQIPAFDQTKASTKFEVAT